MGMYQNYRDEIVLALMVEEPRSAKRNINLQKAKALFDVEESIKMQRPNECDHTH
jgi:hypothetical protein